MFRRLLILFLFQMLWHDIVRQILDQGLYLGVQAELPQLTMSQNLSSQNRDFAPFWLKWGIFLCLRHPLQMLIQNGAGSFPAALELAQVR
jgi:hypothetical protein